MSFLSRNKSLLVIDIHTTDVRIAHVSSDRSIIDMQLFPLPDGVFEKDTITSVEKIAAVITDALPHFPKAPKEAVFIVPDIFCYAQTITLGSDLSKDQEKEYIQQQVSGKIPVPIQDLYWDYFQESKNPSGDRTVVFIGITQKIIDQYCQIAESCAISVVSMEPEMVTLRALLTPGNSSTPEPGMTLLISNGDTAVSLTAFDENHAFVISSVVPFIGGYFTRSVTHSVATQPSDGVLPKLDPAVVGTEKETVFQTALQSIIDEIKKVQHYLENTTNRFVKSIIISGELGLVPDIVTYITSLTGITATTAENDFLKNQKNLERFHPLQSYTRIIGFSLKQSTDNDRMLDFLPKKKNQKIEPAAPQMTQDVTSKTITQAQPASLAKKIIATLFVVITFGILFAIVYWYIILPIRQS